MTNGDITLAIILGTGLISIAILSAVIIIEHLLYTLKCSRGYWCEPEFNDIPAHKGFQIVMVYKIMGYTEFSTFETLEKAQWALRRAVTEYEKGNYAFPRKAMIRNLETGKFCKLTA